MKRGSVARDQGLSLPEHEGNDRVAQDLMAESAQLKDQGLSSLVFRVIRTRGLNVVVSIIHKHLISAWKAVSHVNAAIPGFLFGVLTEAIGGMVMVAKMIVEFNNCRYIG
jgi:hypothetical protein